MSLPLRIVLLGGCVAAGVGLAWAVAISLTPPEESLARERPEGAPAAAAQPPATAAVAAQPAANPWGPGGPNPWGALTPVVAPVHPAVSDQLESLERNMQTIRDAQRDSVAEVQKLLTELRQPGPPPVQPVAAPLSDASPASPAAAVVAEATAPPGSNLPPVSKSDIRRGEGDASLIIHMQDEDIRTALEKLATEGGISIIPSRSVTGTVNASLEGVDVMTALDVILRQAGYAARKQGNFIYVGTADDFTALDRANDKIGSRIYRPNYVRAAELKTLIEGMLTPEIGRVTVSSSAAVGIPADNVGSGGDSFAGNEVLMVRDYEAVLAEVDQIICDVDTQPLQVAIEAMILSVKLADKNSLGVDFALLRDKANVRLISGQPLADLANLDITKGGLKFGFLDSSLGVFISALESIGDTNVVASPHLMCLNKQRAEILIGSQLGYVSTTVTETAATQSVQFLEVGTQLRLRPYITSDGMIRMEVHPELSTGNVRIEGQFTLPNKEVTQVTTNIMVRDGSTVIIGGLIREDLGTAASQIPWLGSLPALGPLFRQKTEDVGRHEIIVLITPRIVHDPQMSQQGKRAECDFLQRQYVYAEKMSPLGKRYLGRRYLRMAKAAYAQGDIEGAVKLAHLAVHFDPLNREAVDFRGVVVQESPAGDRAARPLTRVGVEPCPLDGRCLEPDLPPELLPPPAAGGPVPGRPIAVPGPWNDAGTFVPEELLDPAPAILPQPSPTRPEAVRPAEKPSQPLPIEPAEPPALPDAPAPSSPPQGSSLRLNPALVPPLMPASTTPRRVPVGQP